MKFLFIFILLQINLFSNDQVSTFNQLYNHQIKNDKFYNNEIKDFGAIVSIKFLIEGCLSLWDNASWLGPSYCKSGPTIHYIAKRFDPNLAQIFTSIISNGAISPRHHLKLKQSLKNINQQYNNNKSKFAANLMNKSQNAEQLLEEALELFSNSRHFNRGKELGYQFSKVNQHMGDAIFGMVYNGGIPISKAYALSSLNRILKDLKKTAALNSTNQNTENPLLNKTTIGKN